MKELINGPATLLRRHGAYCVFATATLAAAVGMNVLVSTVVNALWLRPLPFPEAGRLVTITSHVFVSLEAPALKIFDAVAGQVLTDDLPSHRIDVRFDGVGRDLETIGVTPGYFHLLGISCYGRDFVSGDDLIGAEAVAIISDRLWSEELQRRPHVIGSVIRAHPLPLRIIGVAPPGFQGARRGENVDVWIPSNLVPRVLPSGQVAGSVALMILARPQMAQTPAAVTRRVREAFAGDRHFSNFAVARLDEVLGTPGSLSTVVREGQTLGVVAGLALLVLLGGCATLAALVLVHYERRREEFAIRLSLGCSRRRLVFHMVSELGVLAVAGVVAALVVASLGLRVLPALTLPGGIDLARLDLSIDRYVLGAATLATLLTLLLATWLPIARSTRSSLARELVTGSAATPTASSHRLRQSLLALHVCVAIIVLVAAGLFVRAVLRASWAGPGFDMDRTLFVTCRVMPPIRNLGQVDMWMQRSAERAAGVREAIRRVPGVDQVAYGESPVGRFASRQLVSQVVQTARGNREVLLGMLAGGPDLLSALGVPVLVGRGLTKADTSTAPTPTVVTVSLAQILWPAENPLGRTFLLSGRKGGRFIVVGIARDFIYGSFSKPAAGVMVTYEEDFGLDCPLVVRAADPSASGRPIVKATQAVLPDMGPPSIASGRDIIMRDIGRQRLGAWFFSGFGLTALILSIGGTFGLVAHMAQSRQREFGIRLALGATSSCVLHHGVAAALVPVCIGIGAGLVCAALVSQVFVSLLAGLTALDPPTYCGVAILMLCSAAGAALGAAWRLRGVAPAAVLRTP